MNLENLIIAICSLLFFMIGTDKLFPFMESGCSLMNHIPRAILIALGILQLSAGILIWLPKFRKYVAGFFFVFMVIFTFIHLIEKTYDIGGSVFMAVLLGLLVLNPGFIKGRDN